MLIEIKITKFHLLNGLISILFLSLLSNWLIKKEIIGLGLLILPSLLILKPEEIGYKDSTLKKKIRPN